MSETYPKAVGKPAKIDTEQLPCPNCGVVQQMAVYQQHYDNAPTAYFTDHECAVCETQIDMPW